MFKNSCEKIILNFSIIALLYTHSTTADDAVDCMSGDGIQQAFVVNNICFWVYDSGNFSDWNTAVAACAATAGSLAVLDSDATNTAVAALLTRPAFIGYHKSIDGTWGWNNGSSAYTHSYTETGTPHMALLDTTGDWEMTHIDAKKYVYDILCSLERDPYLRCPDVSVYASSQDNQMPLYSGQSVTFTCNDGYHVTVGIDEQTLYCLPGNKWSFPARDCKPIECDLIDPPAYTIRNSEDHFVGDIITYTCTNDTWFAPGVSSKIFTCEGDGYWNPPLEPCKFVRCDPPPYLFYGTLDNTVTLYEHTITYTCISGYKFADDAVSKTITCQGTGPTWAPSSEIAALNCTAIQCPNLPETGSSTFERNSPQGMAVGSYQVWYCEEGTAQLDGEVGTSALCLQSLSADVDNDWDRTIPDCITVGCDGLTVAEANVSLVLPKYNYEHALYFNCTNEGFVFPGGETEMTINCESDQQWDYEIPLSGCHESGCEEGWVKFNEACYFFSDGNALGLRYEYAEETCNYRYSNLAMVTSEKEAAWIATQTYDIYETDFWIGYHENYLKEWVWKGGRENNFTKFAEGYPEFYKCARTSVKGFWKDRNCDELLPYICKKSAICGPAPEIAHGSAISLPQFPVNAGTKITYSCEANYIFKGIGQNLTIQCEEGGYWSKISNCVPTTCPLLNLDGQEVENAWFDTTNNVVGSQVTFTCHDGMLFSDGDRQKTIECLSDGTWNNTQLGKCTNFKCPQPALPDTTPKNKPGLDELGDMNYYSCEPGYSFQDGEVEKLFWCSRDGIWLPTGLSCVRRSCPIYTVPHATVTPEQGVYEDEIVVECNPGYQFPDESTKKILTCEVNGNWSDELPACIATKCEGPRPPDVEGAYRDTDVIQSGTVVNYTCLDDLVFINGDKYRIATCDIVTLQWLSVPTDCVEEAVIIKNGHTYPPEEAKSGPAYGTIGLTLIGTLIVVILVLDLGTLSRFIPCGKSSTADNLVELESQGQTEMKRKPKTKIKKQKTERQTSGRKSSAPPDSKSQNTSQEKEEENSDSETDEDEW